MSYDRLKQRTEQIREGIEHRSMHRTTVEVMSDEPLEAIICRTHGLQPGQLTDELLQRLAEGEE